MNGSSLEDVSPLELVTSATSCAGYNATCVPYLDDSERQRTELRERNALLFDLGYRARLYLSEPAYIIALTLGLISVIMNLLSILALAQIRNKLNTHYKLITSLSLSDMLIGISILLHVINKIVNVSVKPGLGPPSLRLRSRCTFIVIKALNSTGLLLSLLNLLLMSIDHYLAITHPLRYPYLSNTFMTRALIVAAWVIAFLCGFSDFFTWFVHPYQERDEVSRQYMLAGIIDKPITYNYCERVFKTPYREEYSIIVTAIICLVVMVTLYVSICIRIRKHHAPGDMSDHQVNQRREQKRNRKAVTTTLLVLGSFIVCWLPTCLFQITLILIVQLGVVTPNETFVYIFRAADKYLYDILLLNCILDPIIYTVRCFEVRVGYRRLYRAITGAPSQQEGEIGRWTNTRQSLLSSKKRKPKEGENEAEAEAQALTHDHKQDGGQEDNYTSSIDIQ